MNKKMKNSHKLDIFSCMLKRHIYLELVQNRWVVIRNVKTFIMNIYRIFIKVEWFCINTKHWHFGFLTNLLFQQIIKLGNQKLMFPFNIGANLTLDLLHLTFFIKHKILPMVSYLSKYLGIFWILHTICISSFHLSWPSPTQSHKLN